MTLEAIKYKGGKLEILDQLLLPHETKYIPVNNTEDGWTAIKTMQVGTKWASIMPTCVCRLIHGMKLVAGVWTVLGNCSLW